MLKIDFNKFIQKNIPKDFIQPRRSQIYVGYTCHQGCAFCYYKKHNSDEMFQKEFVIRQIDLELKYGIKDFEITGGEPSECRDLDYYCKYIKDNSPDSKIAVITNGGLCTNDNVWEYIDEVLVSYHAPKDDTLVDKKIFPFGSTYNKVKKTIDIARSLNKIIRTNTVVGTFNSDQIDLLVNDLIMFSPDIINFLPINLFDDANDMEDYIDYTKIKPILKKQIDRLEELLPNALKFVRYIPFCDMEGYEKHIMGSWQHIFDWFDWNPELCGFYLIDYLNKFKTNEEILNYLGKYGQRSYERTYDCVKSHYEKHDKCLKCKFYLICDGMEKSKNHRLLNQVIPAYGKLIKNPMQFIGKTIFNKYMQIYGRHLEQL